MNELSSVGGSGSNLQPAKVSHEPGQAMFDAMTTDHAERWWASR